MTEDSSSESEFWEDYDVAGRMEGGITFSFITGKALQNVNVNKQQATPTHQAAIQKLHTQMDHDVWQKAKDEEFAQVRIQLSNKIKREIKALVDKERDAYQGHMGRLLRQYEAIQLTIAKRDKEYAALADYGHGMDELISMARSLNVDTGSLQHHKSQMKSLKGKQQEYQLEIQRLKARLSSLREIKGLFLSDSVNEQNQLQDAKTYVDTLKRNHESSIIKLKSEHNKRAGQLSTEIQQLQQEFHEFKQKTQREKLARGILKERQTNMIENLHSELTNAKIVLQNPRLRNEFHDKLKTSSAECRLNGSRPPRRPVYSAVLQTRLMRNNKLRVMSAHSNQSNPEILPDDSTLKSFNTIATKSISPSARIFDISHMRSSTRSGRRESVNLGKLQQNVRLNIGS